jgi:hypothetical protein
LDRNTHVCLDVNKGANLKTTNKATMRVEAATSRYGNPQPQLTIEMPRGTHYRRLSAALYRAAAAIEMATPDDERWVVGVEATSDERGRIYLELSETTEDEAARALAVLRGVAG